MAIKPKQLNQHNPKLKVSNGQFSVTRFFLDIYLVITQHPDTSLTAKQNATSRPI